MRKKAATYSGKVCAAHPELGGLRKKSTRTCVACSKEKAAAYYQSNLEENRRKRREHARVNIATNTERALAWAKENKERHAANSNRWYRENAERARSFTAKWVSNNLDRCAERESKKRAVSKKATPGWANDFFMREAYRLARLRTKLFGFKWQVDHIVPLINKDVCGLHCEDNMRVIPAKQNAAKGNRWWPNMASA